MQVPHNVLGCARMPHRHKHTRARTRKRDAAAAMRHARTSQNQKTTCRSGLRVHNNKTDDETMHENHTMRSLEAGGRAATRWRFWV